MVLVEHTVPMLDRGITCKQARECLCVGQHLRKHILEVTKIIIYRNLLNSSHYQQGNHIVGSYGL